tara:strand:+ start:144 stop:446 length:303 start_codon:yes stop_codon:yes gene_type:complete
MYNNVIIVATSSKIIPPIRILVVTFLLAISEIFRLTPEMVSLMPPNWKKVVTFRSYQISNSKLLMSNSKNISFSLTLPQKKKKGSKQEKVRCKETTRSKT